MAWRRIGNVASTSDERGSAATEHLANVRAVPPVELFDCMPPAVERPARLIAERVLRFPPETATCSRYLSSVALVTGDVRPAAERFSRALTPPKARPAERRVSAAGGRALARSLQRSREPCGFRRR